MNKVVRTANVFKNWGLLDKSDSEGSDESLHDGFLMLAGSQDVLGHDKDVFEDGHKLFELGIAEVGKTFSEDGDMVVEHSNLDKEGDEIVDSKIDDFALEVSVVEDSKQIRDGFFHILLKDSLVLRGVMNQELPQDSIESEEAWECGDFKLTRWGRRVVLVEILGEFLLEVPNNCIKTDEAGFNFFSGRRSLEGQILEVDLLDLVIESINSVISILTNKDDLVVLE